MKAQATLTLTRIRTGQTILINPVIENGLAQSITEDGTEVVPNWETASEIDRPKITINVQASDGAKATILRGGKWFYNTTEIIDDDRFEITDGTSNTESGANNKIIIVKNLASVGNFADDTLEFEGVARVDGVEFKINKQFNISITKIGGTTYAGILSADNNTFSSSKTSELITIKAKLIGGTGEIPTDQYTVEWSGAAKPIADNPTHTIKIDRSYVDNQALIYGKFKMGQDVIAYATVTINDIADEYLITLDTSLNGGGSQFYSDDDIKITAAAFRRDDGKISSFTTIGSDWSFSLADKNFEPINSGWTKQDNVMTVTEAALKNRDKLFVTASLN